MKASVVEGFKQLLLIVFSVVLGIYLSERIEERKNEKDAAILMTTIESEIRKNAELLEYWTPYHREVVHKVDSLANDAEFITQFTENEYLLYEKAFSRGTLMNRTPSRNAWDIATAHPLIVYIDFDKLLVLSKVYDQQELTYASVPAIIDKMSSANWNEAGYARGNLMDFSRKMGEVTGREIQLRTYLREAVEVLGIGSN